MSDTLPGKGLFGWLGRQVGHIKRAVHVDVAAPEITYRKQEVAEVDHPEQPGVKLRRTTIDEVIVEKQLSTNQAKGHEAEKDRT